MAISAATLQIELEAVTDGLERGLKSAQSTMESAGRKMEAAGKTLTAAVTAPLVAMGAGAVTAFTDYEDAITGVRKTVDATPESFAQLEQEIRNLTARLPASITEIAGVAEAAGQLGVATGDIAAFTETMVQLGTTTNLQAEQAATELARFMNVMGTASGDVERLGSTVVDLGNNFATTEAEIVEMAARLSGAGRNIGLAETDILGLATALSSVGINAEAGGTAFSRVMVEIQNAADQGGSALDSFAQVAGMTASQFRQSFEEDAASAIVAFVEGLGRMQAQGQPTSKVLDDLGLAGVRVQDALNRSANAGDLLRDALSRGSEAWQKNTALAEEANLRYGTLTSNLQILKNNVVAAAAELGENLAPAVRFVSERISDAMSTVSGLTETQQTWLVSIGAAAAALGPLLLAVGKLATAIPTMVAAIKGAGAALVALNPVVTGIAASLAALGVVYMELGTDWDRWSQAMTVTFNNFVSDVLQKASVLSGTLGKLLEPISPAVAAVFNTAAVEATEAMMTIQQNNKAILSQVTVQTRTESQAAQQALSGAMQQAARDVQAAMGNVEFTMQGAGRTVLQEAQRMEVALTQMRVQGVEPVGPSMDKLAVSNEQMARTVEKNTQNAVKGAEQGMTRWDAEIKRVAATLSGTFHSAVQRSVSALLSGGNAFNAAINTAKQSLIRLASDGISKAISGIGSFVGKLVTGKMSASGALSSVVGAAKGAGSSLMGVMGAAGPWGLAAAGAFGVMKALGVDLGDVWGGIKTGVKAAGKAIGTAFKAAGKAAKAVAKTIAAPYKFAFNQISSAVKKVTGFIGSAFKGAFNAVKGIAKGAANAVKGIIGGIGSAVSGVAGAIGGLFGGGEDRGGKRTQSGTLAWYIDKLKGINDAKAVKLAERFPNYVKNKRRAGWSDNRIREGLKDWMRNVSSERTLGPEEYGPILSRVGLASGGLVFGPTNALIGEYPGARSNPEMVAPADKMMGYIETAVRRAGGGGNQTIRVMLDGRVIAEAAVEGMPDVLDVVNLR